MNQRVTYPDLEQGARLSGYNTGELKNGLPAPRGYNDVCFAILFWAHVIAVIGLAVYGGKAMNDANNLDPVMKMKMMQENMNPLAGLHIPWDLISKIAIVVLATSFAGFFIGVFWLWLMRNFPKQLIIGTMIIQGILWIAGAIYMLYIRAYIGAVLGLLGALITFAVWFFNRHRIPFAAAILSTVAAVTRRFPGTIAVCFVALIVQCLWSGVWGFATATSMFYATSTAVGALLYVFFLLSLYWTAEVIRNTGHTTVCGTFATWYFMGGQNNNMPHNPTLKSAGRALTTSFGSICFGSLIVAIIQTVRALLRSLRRKNADNIAVQIVVCLIDCILACIEGLVRYFNRYAYVQVAIYGKSFCDAAKDTWKLVQSHGIDAMINDSFIGPTLTIGILLGGLVCFAVGALVGVAITQVPMNANDASQYAWLVFAILGFLIGMLTMTQAMLVVDSGVMTIFVAYAMDPNALRSNDAELADHFAAVYNGPNAVAQREQYRG